MDTETSIELLAALVEMKSSFTSQMTTMEKMIHLACLKQSVSTQNEVPISNQTVRRAASNSQGITVERSSVTPKKRTLTPDHSGPKPKISRSRSLSNLPIAQQLNDTQKEPFVRNATKAAKVKRPCKTVDSNPLNAGQATPMDALPVAKNTNAEHHSKNTLYNSLCIYCGASERFLVRHYVKQHPEHEVPIARPSPEMVNKIRSQVEVFLIEGVKIKGMCYFCDETKEIRRPNWTQHYLTHTGEPAYACNICNQQFDRKVHKHANCSGEVLNISEINSSDGRIISFMCKDCNYMQFHLPSMTKHLEEQHGYALILDGHQYDKVVLVPDMSPVQTDIFGDYELNEKRFECTICNAQSLTVNDFIEHFDEHHIDSNEYTCLCGENITANDDNLTSKMITDHLCLHSTEFYQCMLCNRFFDDKSGIKRHIINQHRDSENIKFRQFSRNPDQQPRVSESIIRKFQCNPCKSMMKGTFAALYGHFKEEHKSKTVDATAIISRKSTFMANASSKGLTTYVGGTNCVINSHRSGN